MCLKPISLVNPKKNISLYGGISYKMTVPCGECAECNKRKQSEWYFRAYYESKYTFDNGGYVYFDTLTYANEYLPHVSDFCPELKGHISDFSCFNLDHYRLFFRDLRRQLEYYGFDVRHKLKYFLTSEYGVDDRYTHRPHYHVLFFVLDKSLDPIVLSQFIAKCWKYGRTDGEPYKGGQYVLNHTFGHGFCVDQVHMQTICNYVSKYVTKDNKFQKTIDSRINVVMNKRFGTCEVSAVTLDYYKKVKKNMCQFHRQSYHFGESFFEYNDMEQVFKTGMISMPDKNNIVKHIPLPNYYARKIFFDLIKSYDGHLRWQINELGIKYKLTHRLKSIELFTKKFEEWQLNMENKYMSVCEGYVDDDGHRWTQSEVEEWYSSHLDRFNKLLGDRTLKDFVIYLLCYKGRVKSPEEVQREYSGIYRVDPLDSFVMREFAPQQLFGYKQVYNYAHHVYRDKFGCKFVTDKDLGDTVEWKNEGIPQSVYRFISWKDYCERMNGYVPGLLSSYSASTRSRRFGDCKSTNQFESQYVINDSADPKFKYFDEMYWIWCDSLVYYNIEKQKFHDWKKDYQDRMKSIGLLKKSI